MYIELTALDDSEPEQVERFTVQLKNPDNSAVLGGYTQRLVLVNPNDSPNGLINLYFRGTRYKFIQSLTSTQYTQGCVYEVLENIHTFIVEPHLSGPHLSGHLFWNQLSFLNRK